MTSLESSDSNAVEVNGIRFETLLPEQVLTIPNMNNGKTSVQFGIRVTNLSLTPYHFIFFHLLPELLVSNGQVIHRHYGRNVTKAASESDFLLAMPRESLTFFIDARFFWYKLQASTRRRC